MLWQEFILIFYSSNIMNNIDNMTDIEVCI